MSDAQVPRDVLDAGGDSGSHSPEQGSEPEVIMRPAETESDGSPAPPSLPPHASADGNPPVFTIRVPMSSASPQNSERDEQTPSEEALPEIGEAADAPSPAPLVEPLEPNAEMSPQDDGAAPGLSEFAAPPPTGALEPAADEEADAQAPVPASLTEVSPIFSALDAAERTAETTLQPPTSPDMDRVYEGELVAPDQPSLVNGTVVPEGGAQEEQALTTADEAPLAAPGEEVTFDSVPETVAQEEPAPPAEEPQRPHAEILQDAAARIAAEASATAAALENLKRLLVHKLPESSMAPSPVPRSEDDRAEPTAPPPLPAYRPPAHMPITPPPMMPASTALPLLPEEDDEPRRPKAAVGSFFAGFALSWVFGAVLYVFLTAG
jgi:hypothetical protein